MSSPGASSAWQTTAPAQAPPAPEGYYQQPPQPMYARPPAVQQGYYPHLLPGQPGVPEVRLVKLRVHSCGPLLPPGPRAGGAWCMLELEALFRCSPRLPRACSGQVLSSMRLESLLVPWLLA
jgi:hypothetical protein